jgi:fumarylacetoacetase
VDGSERSFLLDGDSLVIAGCCRRDGYRIGFGQVEGTIVASADIRDAGAL